MHAVLYPLPCVDKCMTNKVLGRYRILGELGHGAMGTVYRALDPLIEREVAIKTLHPDLPAEEMSEVRERFLREARSAGRLNHPNIVTVFDVGEDQGVAYMAMELLEGRSLQQILRDPDRLPFATVAGLVAQIADGLDRAQQLGIVHRDVKPANVVVSSSGHAKLTDFGVAYVPSSTMTQTGTMIGSPRYMSPEQVLGLPIDPRSDIFSLGIVLYEMLAGTPPFVRTGDTTIFPLMNRIAVEPHPPIMQLAPGVPQAFERILGKALAKRPEIRYQRAAEMARDLRNFLEGKPESPPVLVTDDDKTMVFQRSDVVGTEDYEKTVVVSRLPLPAAVESERKGNPPAVDLDLESFSRNFEVEERARLRAEEEARKKKADELRRWKEAELRKLQVGDQPPGVQGESLSGANGAAGARPSALDLLRTQSRKGPSEKEVAQAKDKADRLLDGLMNEALQYLAQISNEISAVNPTSGRSYDYIFLGRLSGVKLSQGFADLRSEKVNGTEYASHVVFKYRIQPISVVKATLLGKDITRLDDLLSVIGVSFDRKDEAKDDFGNPTRAIFTISGSLPCEINIRANYDKQVVEIEQINVRHPGRVRCTVTSAAFGGKVDELVRYALGLDDDFSKTLFPVPAKRN